MKTINSEEIAQFLWESINCLNEQGLENEYYHVLLPEDEKPVVVHHSTFQCTVVLDGEGIATVNGKQEPIKKNDVIMIKAGESHQFTAIKPLKLFHIHIPFETADSDRSILGGKDFKMHT